MPKFEITSPDGRLFEVNAPEGASQAEVLAYAQQNFGQPKGSTVGQKALGVGEAALSAGTGVLSQLIGNVAGVGKEVLTGDFGKGTAEKTAQQVQQALTYQPRGEVAPQILAKAKVPASADIKAQASQLYQKIDDAGVLIKSEPFGQLVDKIKVDIGGKIRQIRQPNVVDAINQLDEATGSAMTLRKLQDLRSSISEIKLSKNMSESKFAGDIIKELDDFVDNLDASKLVAPAQGDVEAIKLVPQARNLWKQARKSELLDELYEKAGLQPNAKYDDVVFATKLRDQFRNLATNKNKLRGFTEEEVKAIKSAAQGGKIENALRAFGKPLQGTVLQGQNVASLSIPALIGFKLGGPTGAVVGANLVPASRAVSRRVAGALGKQNLQNVIDTIKTGGQPYSGVQLAPFVKLNPITGTTVPTNAINSTGLLAPYMTNPEDYKSLL